MKNDIYFRDQLNTRHNEISAHIGFSPSCYEKYGVDLITKIVTENSDVFPNHENIINDAKRKTYAPWQTAGRSYFDSWGVEWRTSVNGITGAAIKPSIGSWDDFEKFIPPNPEFQNGWGEMDWPGVEKVFAGKTKAGGKAITGGLRHGFLFLTLTYIRGFENLVYDMYDDEPKLAALIDMVYEFNKYFVDRYLALGADIFSFPEDLGSQTGPLIAPDKFRKYLKPVYLKLMRPVKDKNKTIYMHSDGLILDLIDDLIESGVDIINLQDLVNGIDNIKKHVKGRMGIALDIDRQRITVFGSVKDIDDHIKEAVMKLGDNELGFSMFHQVYQETPVENIYALADAYRKYREYYC